MEELSVNIDYPAQQGNQYDNNESSGETPAARLIEYVLLSTSFYKNELGEGYAAINYGSHKETYAINSKQFERICVGVFYEEERAPIKKEHISQAIAVFEMKACFSNVTRTLGKRVTSYQGNYYYDLVNDNWQVIKITKEACKIDNNPPVLFTRGNNMKTQVFPDFTVDSEELMPLLDKHFEFKKKVDKILFGIYLVSCFVPDIPHPIIVLHGEKGSSKSTTMRKIKSIVDPSKCDLLTLPNSIQNLALSLSSNYMPAYDNLQSISPEKSDLLCMGATGGSFSTRTLYTNGEETIVSFKRVIALNGINIVASRPDLLDRSILLELERIKEENRKPESLVWRDFDKDKPRILGACFNALSKAMSTISTVRLDKLGRMADFCLWGYAIAEAIGINGDEFVNAYLENQDSANEEALESNPLAATIVKFMKDKGEWSDSVASLLEELKLIAVEHSINLNDPLFPKASHVLSKRLKEVKSNLEKVGINYSISNAGAHKLIVITNSIFEE